MLDLEPHPHPRRSDKLDQFADDKQNVWSLFEHFFKVLSLYLEAKIRIRSKVTSRILIKGKNYNDVVVVGLTRLSFDSKSRLKYEIPHSSTSPALISTRIWKLRECEHGFWYHKTASERENLTSPHA
jgi:hypothetical protein